MNREAFVKENWRYLNAVSNVYARKFFTEKDDLVQEGALGFVEVFDAYAKKLDEKSLIKVARKVANRKMYRFIKNEIKARRFL